MTDSGQEYVACEVDALILEKTTGQGTDFAQKEWKKYHKTPEPTFQDLLRLMNRWHNTWFVKDEEVPF